MQQRTFVTFNAEFPEDWQWDEKGNLTVPGGHGIANAIIFAMRSAGLSATEPVQHSFYGWSFEFTLGGLTSWCVLQFPGPWLLQVEDKRKGFAKFFGRTLPAEFERALESVDRILKGDARFSSIQWFTRDEYESGVRKGADVPCVR